MSKFTNKNCDNAVIQQPNTKVLLTTPSHVPPAALATPKRPPCVTSSTVSSTSSKTSIQDAEFIFDKTASPSCPGSPITPPDEPSNPLNYQPGGSTTNSVDQRLIPSPQNANKRRTKKTSNKEKEPQRLANEDTERSDLDTPTRSASSRKLRSSKSPRIGPSTSRSLATPITSTRQRSRSVPSSSAEPDPFQSDERIGHDPLCYPELPGAFDTDVEPQHCSIHPEIEYEFNALSRTTTFSSAGNSDHSEAGISRTHPRLAFVQLNKTKNIRAINASILKCIKKKRQPAKIGWIYILQSPAHAPLHVKIGRSEYEPGKRTDDWERCFLLATVDDVYLNGFEHFSIVESLIMAQHYNKRKRYYCERHKYNHVEWYELPCQEAVKSVDMWRRWILIQRPYDSDWKLTSYWEWRVQQLPKILNDVVWEKWTQPGHLEFLDYWLSQNCEGYYLRLKKHLSRKDHHFLLVGTIIGLILKIYFGRAGVVWSIVGLLAL